MQKISVYRRNIIYLSTGLISALFVLKYAEIYLNLGFASVLFYAAFFTGAVYLSGLKVVLNRSRYFKTAGFLLLVSVLAIYLTPRLGSIGRLPSIVDWWDLFFQGTFPYNSHLTPSSFPFLFVTALPFYLIGQIGWLVVIGLTIILLAISKFEQTDQTQSALTILIISPVIWYDLAVRSELTYNISLFIAAVLLIESILSKNLSVRNVILSGIISGLVLSTRSIIAVPLAAFLVFKFKTEIPKLIISGVVTALVFGAILAPFYFWSPAAFLSNGPFAIQAKLSNIPIWVSGTAVIAAVFFGWREKNLSGIYFYTGLISLAVILISYLLKVNEFGFHNAFFEDKIDLSYLAFSFPLLLLALRSDETKTST